MFDHTLDRENIFDIPNLVELSKRLVEAYYVTSKGTVKDGWKSHEREPKSLQEAIATIGDSNTLVLLKGLADDAEFGPICRRVLAEVEEQVGEALRADLSEGRATLVISSPGRVTPYHIDAETNFLLQLRGDKVVHIFDPRDRTVLTDRELEAFYSGDMSAAKYKEDRQRDASVFDFSPGKGLHLPILAPHWTQNGNSVSVAISINCSLRSNRRLAKVYRFNKIARKLKFSPSSPGISVWKDRFKAAAVDGIDVARRML
ncbi:MAG: cupin-like domain-containing protein [Candidatus Eremiobacteraeota bacterium]|nr:cupin-like domain-containing protein [Candidatus Eremiobacteraeota bacterium]